MWKSSCYQGFLIVLARPIFHSSTSGKLPYGLLLLLLDNLTVVSIFFLRDFFTRVVAPLKDEVSCCPLLSVTARTGFRDTRREKPTDFFSLFFLKCVHIGRRGISNRMKLGFVYSILTKMDGRALLLLIVWRIFI